MTKLEEELEAFEAWQRDFNLTDGEDEPSGSLFGESIYRALEVPRNDKNVWGPRDTRDPLLDALWGCPRRSNRKNRR